MCLLQFCCLVPVFLFIWNLTVIDSFKSHCIANLLWFKYDLTWPPLRSCYTRPDEMLHIIVLSSFFRTWNILCSLNVLFLIITQMNQEVLLVSSTQLQDCFSDTNCWMMLIQTLIERDRVQKVNHVLILQTSEIKKIGSGLFYLSIF